MINLQQIAAQTAKKDFYLGNYCIVSQKPDVMTANHRARMAVLYLPAFIKIWQDIERVTGYRWKNTSYVRDSPSHRKGQAFDLAPDIAASAQRYYAVYKNSDPVLYKREALIRALQSLTSTDYFPKGNAKMGIFIEPDHLHLQVLDPNGGGTFPTEVVKWKVAKPIYADTYQRMTLPMFKS